MGQRFLFFSLNQEEMKTKDKKKKKPFSTKNSSHKTPDHLWFTA